MKSKIFFCLYMLLVLTSFAKKPPTNATIQFTISKKNEIKVSVNGTNIPIKEDSAITVQVEENQKLIFKVDAPAQKKYQFQISVGEAKEEFSEPDFKSNNSVSTDENLKIGELELSNKNFEITINITGSDALFRQNFKVLTRPKTKPGSTSPAVNQPHGNHLEEVKPYIPGSMYYDAISLSHPDKLTPKEYIAILRHYFTVRGAEAKSIPDWISFLQHNDSSNSFFKMIDPSYYNNVDSLLKKESTQAFSQSLISNLASSISLSSIGGLDVTTIADGLAKFLVKRTKEELNMAFFEKFKEKIDSCKDLQVLFPQTSALLGSVGEQIYDYNRYLQNLREAFKEDIIVIHRNLPGIIINHPTFFAVHKDLEVTLRSGCYIASGLDDQIHPGDILDNYPVEYLDKLDSKNFKGAIQTLQLFSASLRDTGKGDDANYWVGIKQIRDLVNDKLAFTIYLGLIYQQARNKVGGIQFQNVALTDILDEVALKFDTVYDSYKRYVLGFGEKANSLNKMIKDHQKPSTDSATVELYAKYFKASVDMIEYCTAVTDLPRFNDPSTQIGNLHITLKPYFDITYSVTDMVTDANRRNYSAVINHAIHIYNVIVVNRHKEDYARIEAKLTSDKNVSKKVKRYDKHIFKLEKITGTSVPENVKQYISDTLKYFLGSSPDSTAAYSKLFKGYDSSLSNLNALVKYGGFMASVATAKTSNDVAEAVETFALPTGSSRIKRVSNFNVALNAYVGLYAGFERIRGYDTGKWKLNTAGITAPIGVAASWGRRVFWIPTGRSEWSTSIFVSLIDIGAVTAFRFKNDTSVINVKPGQGNSSDTTVSSVPSQTPTIQLENILSPGAFISIGIPKTPISVNMGVQAGPNLRKININENGIPALTFQPENKLYFRYSISVCVDIPILNFYTKSR